MGLNPTEIMGKYLAVLQGSNLVIDLRKQMTPYGKPMIDLRALAQDYRVSVKSGSEERFRQAAIKHGHQVLHCYPGWPDFLLYHEDGSGKPWFVEVKTGWDILRPEQEKVLRILARYVDTKIAPDGDFDNLLTIDEYLAHRHYSGKARGFRARTNTAT